MLCSRCVGSIAGTAWTISVIWVSGKCQGINLCKECAIALLSHAALARVTNYLDRTGWVQLASGTPEL